MKSEHNKQKGRASTLKNHTKKDHLSHVNHLPILKTNTLFYLYAMLEIQINILPALVLGRQTNFNFSTKSYVIQRTKFALSQDYLPLAKIPIEPDITYTY